MKKIFSINICILLFAALAILADSSHAAAQNVLVSLGDTEQELDNTTVDSWRGTFTVGTKPLFMGGIKTQTRVSYNPKQIYNWASALELQINSEPISGSLSVQGKHATTFIPPKIGKRLDPAATTTEILQSLMGSKESSTGVVYTVQPEHSLASTNNLGINELIGKGTSNFKGSPKNRRHNIATGIEKLQGVILAPGEVFSFNENICPVEKETGYLPELVIKADGTKPEYGGGLCQVSSTIFRAAMDAGLKIVQRKNHSYAVQYYAPQGTDATTYCGGVDFKFQNDTAHHILIWPYLIGKDDLAFDLYGTKDTREIVIEKAVQYDRKSDGSMKATWIRHVTKNGVTKTDTLNSNYLPPALFHKEEKLDTPGQTTTPPTDGTPPVTEIPPLTPTPPTITPPPPAP